MPRKKFKKIIFKKRKFLFFKFLLGFIFIIFLFSFSLIFYFLKDLPRPENFKEGVIAQSTKIYDRTGKIILYEIFNEEKRTIVPLEEISPWLQKAVIAAEDKNFFSHKGVDIKAILRALLYDLKFKKPIQGGSTITQQLIRSYFLTRKKTLKRKTREIILTIEAERRYSKNQILEWYLNLVPLGGNIYGVEEAARSFFGKSARDLSLAESATIAALIKSPTYFSPYGKNKEKLLKRKDYILEIMKNLGFISQEEFLKAQKEEVVFQPKTNKILAPHFVLFVKNYLEQKYGKEFLYRKGLKVYTTLDYSIQKKAEEIIKNANIEQFGAHNASLLAVNAKTGEILAMVGSKDYFGESYPKGCIPGKNCKFDPKVNIVFSLRQPGSAFKPFVYAKSFLEGLTPQTIIWDVKTEFNLNCPPSADKEYGNYHVKCYHPKNYTNTYAGPISLKRALAESRNVPAVKVLYIVGLDNVINFVKKFGITTLKNPQNYGLSLVLGAGEVKLYEMVEGYSVFAREGIKIPLSFIKKIETPDKKILEEPNLTPLRIIPSFVAQEINDILSDNEARARMFGRNSYLYIKNYSVAAKTGTTQKHKDAWVFGYSPNVVVGVWVGNNDNSPMKQYAAVTIAGPIWKEFMEFILPKFPKEDFKKPKKRETKKPMLDGKIVDNHCLLYWIRKNDPQVYYWEKAIEYWLKNHKLENK